MRVAKSFNISIELYSNAFISHNKNAKKMQKKVHIKTKNSIAICSHTERERKRDANQNNHRSIFIDNGIL